MVVSVLSQEDVKVRVDISQYWKRDEDGEPVSTNSVFTEIEGTPLEVGRNTLRLAKEGVLDRGHFANLVKLARLCSEWSGQNVAIDDLVKVEE